MLMSQFMIEENIILEEAMYKEFFQEFGNFDDMKNPHASSKAKWKFAGVNHGFTEPMLWLQIGNLQKDNFYHNKFLITFIVHWQMFESTNASN